MDSTTEEAVTCENALSEKKTRINSLKKPCMTTDKAKEVVHKLYGLRVTKVKKLNSYDDQNFWLKVETNLDNPDICKDGYVLKVMNSIDSQNEDLLDAQTKMMLFLSDKGFDCPELIKTGHGKYMTLETLTDDNEESGVFMVRLLKYVPGVILYENVDMDNQILYKLGKYLAQVDKCLEDFHHPAMLRNEFEWSLQNVPFLEKYLHVVENAKDYKMVRAIIESFKSQVVNNISQLKKSSIHGDFNEQNIVLRPASGKGQSSELNMFGILDFGDIHETCTVFDLAVGLAYFMMLTEDPIQGGGHMIAGYLSVLDLKQTEFDCLLVCAAARICQSVVLGLNSYHHDPSNEYLLLTQKTGWKTLHILWGTPKEEVYKIWKEIIDSSQDK